MPKLGSVLAALAAGALAVPALATAAHAADDATVTLTIVDAAGRPVPDIEVSVYSHDRDDEIASLGPTGSDGVLTETGLPTENVTFAAYDTDENRWEARTDYALKLESGLLESGANDVTITLARGAQLYGRVLAPSGRPVKNVSVDSERRGWFESTSIDFTDWNGRYRLTGMGVGTPELYVTRRAWDESDTLRRVSAPSIKTAGSQQAFDIKNVQVQCQTAALALSSPKKGEVKIAVKASAPGVGLANPGGKVYVKLGSKLVKTFYVNGAVQAVTLKKQPLGKTLTYTASYGGGDCFSWTQKKSVKVRSK